MDRPVKDPIADALDVTPLEPKQELIAAGPKKEAPKDQKLENDFEYARENLYNIIERGADALNGIVELAQQSQQPRSYEVVADLVRTLSSANKDLLDIQQKMKAMQPKEEGPSKVTNNLFVGSTNELTALLKGKARDIKNG
jgi:hypothetical protein